MEAVTYPQAIKDWPEDERPRERLVRHGAASLSDAHLLAIILSTGDAAGRRSAVDLARALLGRFGGLKNLDDASVTELCQVKGVGQAKSSQIKAAFELGRRLLSEGARLTETIRASQDVADRCGPHLRGLKKEVFKALLLDTRNRVFNEITISEGNLTASLVHPREAFKPAIRESAAAVVFVHNHPSGDPTPSSEDREVTRRLVETGDIVGIKVLDHVILGEAAHFSFADARLLR